MMVDGFLGRWSKRKQQVREGKPAPEPEARPAADVVLESPESPDHVKPQAAGGAPVMPPPEQAPDLSAPELPTLADVHKLTPESDFTPFMARGVAPEVKNAAMKKLFADPHFNVMDGLDTYVGDYSLPDPIPESMLRQMVSAQFLNLFGEEKGAEIGISDATGSGMARDDPDTAAPEVVAQSASLPAPQQAVLPTPPGQAPAATPEQKTSQTDHDHIDLRLQPDHAAAAQAAGRGAA